MSTNRTPIIPITPTFYRESQGTSFDLKAICIFVAIGFFLDRDSYLKEVKVVPPATEFTLDASGNLTNESNYFQWYYNPRNRPFDEVLDEFITLFEQIILEQVGDRKVILPLSGGLDSRTQAVALKQLGSEVASFSYEFERGYTETKIAKKIAQECSFPFQKFTIPKGYLWDTIEELAQINQCYSEFTHPRQMAVKDKLGKLGEVFSLGHWGDVLFDRGVANGMTLDDFPEYLLKKIVKKGGLELAQDLWSVWGLEGDFYPYLLERISELWNALSIDNLSAKTRAFKSLYWAPRWTSVNLSVFKEVHPITLPYYDNRMCEFICTIPEEYLADRKLQIAYIKRRAPEVAKITWQSHKPFNLYTYPKNKVPYNVPHRVVGKVSREAKGILGKKYVQRNWELQFVGKENQGKLRDYLYQDTFLQWIPKGIIDTYLQKFQSGDAVYYSHPISMLLTLALKTKIVEDEA